jgi:hypothetical protein
MEISRAFLKGIFTLRAPTSSFTKMHRDELNNYCQHQRDADRTHEIDISAPPPPIEFVRPARHRRDSILLKTYYCSSRRSQGLDIAEYELADWLESERDCNEWDSCFEALNGFQK